MARSEGRSIFWKPVQPKGRLVSELCISESFARSRGGVGLALLSGLLVNPSPADGFRDLVWFL